MKLIPLFSITEEQQARLKEWCIKHIDEKHAKGVRDMSGACWKYTIIPTGTGDNIEVECLYCPSKKLILTLSDDGEFLYDLEGRKTWCSSYALTPQEKSWNDNMCHDPIYHMQKCMDKGTHMKSVDKDGDCQYCCHH